MGFSLTARVHYQQPGAISFSYLRLISKIFTVGCNKFRENLLGIFIEIKTDKLCKEIKIKTTNIF